MVKKEKKNDRHTWYKLDLSAIVYPTLQRKDFSSVYRLSVTLTEAVNPDLLQEAIDLTLTRFPYFKVALRKGLFWRYLEPNHRPGPFLQKDIRNFCMPLYFKTNNRYLLRFYYYENKISLEAHHSLGDGNGGMCLLQTLVATYLGLLGHIITPQYLVLDLNENCKPEEYEDAYLRYATAKYRPPRPSEKAYRIRGTKEPLHTFNVINGVVSAKEVINVASKYHVTLTEYLNAVLLYALLQKQENSFHLSLKPVKIAMPVNLRQFFPSITLRNFITMIYPSIDPRLGTYTFEEIVTQVHHYMRYSINKKLLCGDITTNAASQKNPLARVTPLFIKDFIVRTFYSKVQDKNSSAGLTNMGAMKLPEEMKPFISRFDIYMGLPFSTRTNCAIVSFNDILTINFASSIIEADVERYFFRKLVEDGIPVTVESNR